MRLSKAAKELNITIQRIGEFLESHDHEIAVSPNTKIPNELYTLLLNEFKSDINQRQQSNEVLEAKRQKKEALIAVEEQLVLDVEQTNNEDKTLLKEELY